MHTPLKLLLTFVLLLLFSGNIYAQFEYNTESNRAIRKFENALELYRSSKYPDAIDEVKKAIRIDENFSDAYMLLAEIHSAKKNTDKEIQYYQKVTEIAPQEHPKAYYFLGDVFISKGNYKKARNNFKKFLEIALPQKDLKTYIEKKIKQCDFAIEQKNNPVEFDPKNLGKNINTPHADYSPSLTVDSKKIILTVALPQENNTRRMRSRFNEDFFIAESADSGWNKARPVKELNTPLNEGAQSISANGKNMIFTACNRRSGHGSCDLYYSEKEGDTWTKPKNIGPPVNTPGWESQPSLSANGRTLYFVSNRKSGKGKKDIWVSHRKENGKWSVPKNLGDSINTKEQEMTPFIHADNQTLYFSSDGHLGMGKKDLFVARKKADGTWSEPENLGYPINTHRNESGLIVNTKGNQAYFASDRFKGIGKLDIYTFSLPKPLQPQKTTYLKGLVYDAETKEKLKANFKLTRLSDDSTIADSYSDKKTGAFLTSIPGNIKLALTISKKGYLFYSDNFNIEKNSTRTEPYKKKFPLQPVKAGKTSILNNVFFAFDEHNLKSESKTELQRLISFLENNPEIKIEIQGHTDKQGSKEYNKKLSQKRAKVVYEYIINHSINKSRLQYKGYGFKKPIASNETEEGRAKNRRTQFKILE